MRLGKLIALCALALSICAQAQPSVQQSHVEANVPDAGNFNSLLKRDIISFLKANDPGFTELVQVELLRNAPTQSGAAYPKFYAWVKYRTGAARTHQGAARLAAMDKVKFEVTNFVPASEAQSDRASVEKVFPSALVPLIMLRAAAP